MIDINLDAEITLHNVTSAGVDGNDFFIQLEDTNSIVVYKDVPFFPEDYNSNMSSYYNVLRSSNNSKSENNFEIHGVELVNREELENFNPNESSDLKIILRSKDMKNNPYL